MAAESEKQISLKLIIDKMNDKVVYAECNGDFVDILFGFLTLPMGTIVRLINKQSRPQTIGSFTSLYRGVTELSNEYLRTERCKTMLLSPNNSSGTVLQKLKINIDDTEPTKYFANLRRIYCKHLSVVKDVECSCPCSMTNEIFWKDSSTTAGCGEVFVNPNELFIITDDLQVKPASGSVISSLFEVLGINDLKGLQQKTVNVGLDQICGLLKVSLLSKSALTDVFLCDQCIQFRNPNSRPIHIKTESEIASSSTNMSVKLTVRKTDKKIIYAEANEDFIDLLFSMLTIPVGLLVQLLGGNSSLPCVDNLYKSVSLLIDSKPLKEILVAPKLPPVYLCKSPLLDIVKHNISPQLRCSFKYERSCIEKHIFFSGTVKSDGNIVILEPKFIDPKSADGHKISNEGYVKTRATFMVTDDLVVTPFSSFSMISLVRSLNMDISCTEERVIHVGKEKALFLLQASLISGSALTSWMSGSAVTTGLAAILKEPIKESRVP